MINQVFEPIGATQQELEEMNEATQKVIYFQAGLADGSIVTLPKIIEKAEDEKAEYQKEQTKERCEVLRSKILSGIATESDKSELQLLLLSLQVL